MPGTIPEFWSLLVLATLMHKIVYVYCNSCTVICETVWTLNVLTNFC